MGTFRREHGNTVFLANLSSLKFEKDICFFSRCVDFIGNIHLPLILRISGQLPSGQLPHNDAMKLAKKNASRCRSLNLRLAKERKKNLLGNVSVSSRIKNPTVQKFLLSSTLSISIVKANFLRQSNGNRKINSSAISFRPRNSQTHLTDKIFFFTKPMTMAQ